MSDECAYLFASQQGMAARRQLVAAGLSRRRLERCITDQSLRRLRTGVYSDRPMPPLARHRLSGGVADPGYVARVRAVVLSVGAVASRRTAAVLWGFDMAVEPALVEVDVAPGRSGVAARGVDVRRTLIDGAVAVRPVAGAAALPVTSAVDTVLDCALERPLAEAVAIADSAMRVGACTYAELREAVGARRGMPGVGRLRRMLRWCDARSESVLESLLRVLLATHGLAPPETQYVLRDATGTYLGRLDFCWPQARLVVEGDGRRWHDPDDSRDRDRRRDNRCARTGWRVLRFTWAEVVHDPEGVIDAVREALRGVCGEQVA